MSKPAYWMRTEAMASNRPRTEYGDCLASKSTLAKADTVSGFVCKKIWWGRNYHHSEVIVVTHIAIARFTCTNILNRMAWEGTTRRVDRADVTERRGCEGIKIAKWSKRYCAGGQPAIPITNNLEVVAGHRGIPVEELRHGTSCPCSRMAHRIFAELNESTLSAIGQLKRSELHNVTAMLTPPTSRGNSKSTP